MRALIGEKPCFHNCVENTKKIYSIAYAILNGTGIYTVIKKAICMTSFYKRLYIFSRIPIRYRRFS